MCSSQRQLLLLQQIKPNPPPPVFSLEWIIISWVCSEALVTFPVLALNLCVNRMSAPDLLGFFKSIKLSLYLALWASGCTCKWTHGGLVLKSNSNQSWASFLPFPWVRFIQEMSPASLCVSRNRMGHDYLEKKPCLAQRWGLEQVVFSWAFVSKNKSVFLWSWIVSSWYNINRLKLVFVDQVRLSSASLDFKSVG